MQQLAQLHNRKNPVSATKKIHIPQNKSSTCPKKKKTQSIRTRISCSRGGGGRRRMSNKEKQNPSVSAVSTGCSSRIKSYLSLCRPPTRSATPITNPRVLPQQQEKATSSAAPLLPCSNKGSSSRTSADQASSERVRQLELELKQLKQGLISCENRPAGNHKNMVITEARRHLNGKLIRLADGSYLHEINKIGSPWKRLVMQISSPTIVEDVSTAAQVIRAMVSMGIEDLYDCLVESLPMGDIRGYDISKILKVVVMQGSEEGFMEAIILSSIEKIEGLVMEGLRIHMSSTRRGAVGARKNEKEQSKGCAVLLMLIKVRDPEERYETVGDLMVGLIEVSAAEMGERRHDADGVHVAGIKCATTRSGCEEYFMWSVSTEGCSCVRNPDVAFTS